VCAEAWWQGQARRNWEAGGGGEGERDVKVGCKDRSGHMFPLLTATGFSYPSPFCLRIKGDLSLFQAEWHTFTVLEWSVCSGEQGTGLARIRVAFGLFVGFKHESNRW
jgi:hypothetical protein